MSKSSSGKAVESLQVYLVSKLGDKAVFSWILHQKRVENVGKVLKHSQKTYFQPTSDYKSDYKSVRTE